MNSKLNVGDLVKIKPSYIMNSKSLIEGDISWTASGVGVVVEVKEKAMPPVTINKEVTVVWSATGDRSIFAIEALTKVSEKT